MKIKNFAISIVTLMLALSVYGQKNDFALYSIGNFNGPYNVWIGAFTKSGVPTNNSQLIIGDNKSSLGYGLEYRRYWNGPKKCSTSAIAICNAIGIDFDQNPSDGKLVVPIWYSTQTTYIWPEMRYDLAILETQQFSTGHKWAPYVNEGPGVILTNGYSNSGWTASPAVVVGFGINYKINKHFFARGGENYFIAKQGCYGDPTCYSKASMEQVVRAGIGINW